MTEFSSPPPPPPPPPPAPMGMAIQPKGPRPAVTVGAALLIAGGVLMIVGSFLSWFTVDGDTISGFSKDSEGTNDGPFFAVIGGLAIVFGAVQLAVKKVLALGIIGIITSAIGMLGGLADLSDVNDVVDIGAAFGLDVSVGPGLYIVILGSVVAISGAIATIAKRRA